MKSARNYSAPYTSTSFKDYLAEPNLTLATCWKLVSTNNVVVAATTHTRDLVLSGHSGLIFKSTQGIVPSAADSEMGLNSAGLEVDSIFSVGGITEESVASGDWDDAYFEVFLVNYENLDMGELIMFAGTIGEVKTYGERFRAEGRPLTNKATQQIGSVYTHKCTVRRLGDARCKLNVSVGAVAADGGVITTTGTVTTGGSASQFIDINRGEVTGYFTHGTVTFTSGVLAGRTSEIFQHIGTAPAANNGVVRWSTDHTWKVSTSFQTNWHTTNFIDTSWQNSIIQGGLNTNPWLQPIENFPTDTSAQWIWNIFSIYSKSTVGRTAYFRKTFTPNVSSAKITIAADDEYTLYVNGTSVGTGSSWTVAQTYDISLNPNVLNSIAVQVYSQPAPSIVNNPAGLLADVKFTTYTPPPSGSGSTIQLAFPMPRIIEAGTTYTITRGCDREWLTCKNAFDNLPNFRGFPHVPGIERAYKINQ